MCGVQQRHGPLQNTSITQKRKLTPSAITLYPRSLRSRSCPFCPYRLAYSGFWIFRVESYNMWGFVTGFFPRAQCSVHGQELCVGMPRLREATGASTISSFCCRRSFRMFPKNVNNTNEQADKWFPLSRRACVLAVSGRVPGICSHLPQGNKSSQPRPRCSHISLLHGLEASCRQAPRLDQATMCLRSSAGGP